MKELSIEEKGQRYDEALDNAKVVYKTIRKDLKPVVEQIFPELKESDDEKIRKELIFYFQEEIPQCSIQEHADKMKEFIAWLEKQGTPAKLSEEEQDRFAKGVLTSCALSFINYLDAHKYEGKMCVSNGECEDIENAFQNAMWDRLHRYYCKYIEKQGEHLENYNEAEKEKAEFVGDGLIECHADFLDFKEGNTYWLEYIGDDKYNVRSDNLLGKTYHITPCQLYTVFKKLTWLEKQGEQKPIDKIQLGKKYKCIASPRYSTFMTGEIYKPEDKFLCSLMNFCSDCFEPIEDSEQNPADKVEPKFKIGDWIIDNNIKTPFLITGISNEKYDVISIYGTDMAFSFREVEHFYHLWTVQDAEDGDVLVAFNYILIFKELLKNDGGISYCHYDFGTENPQFIWHKDRDWCFGKEAIIHPATKEERDTLMKAIADAGYTFDFEKKELKKIEKNPADIIPEDFEKYVEQLLSLSDGEGHGRPAKVKEVSLKLLKLAKIEQKPAWNEEDERMIDNIIFELEENQENISGVGYKIDWLKSLKNRHTWKPSEEQITWLYRAADDASKDSRMKQILNELLSDLKKLMEEWL